MNSFTYEPNTFLMLAKHDDLNFTNFFEYDASGNLERSKKKLSMVLLLYLKLEVNYLKINVI